MIVSTPEEIRQFLPSHVLVNIDTVRGFLDNSEHDFLAERIGLPLLARLQQEYKTMEENDIVVPLAQYSYDKRNVWQKLLNLCQRVVVFDAFSRAADVHAISLNDAGLNIAESQGYDAADTKVVDKYKAQLARESHAASNRLLIQLEEWQKSLGKRDAEDDSQPENEEETAAMLSEEDGEATVDPSEDEEEPAGEPVDNEADPAADAQAMRDIIELWKQSAYYYYADGLLFNTATEFGLYVNIYESREKFIQLLPDIRYCQETHIEAEIGTELLLDLIGKHRQGSLGKEEEIAYHKLQRVLSLQVEARSKVIFRKDAKEESIGHTRLAMEYIRRNQTKFDKEAMKTSPLFDWFLWRREEVADENTDRKDPHALKKPPFIPGLPHRDKYLVDGVHRAKCDYDPRDPRLHRPCDHPGDGMLVSSLI